MANIPLQSITFPGLSDKYTTPTVDATLTQTGAAADAKKTGDEIGQIKNDLSDMNTATAEDVGKALKAKTVSGGKVTEWEFGEAGSQTDSTLSPNSENPVQNKVLYNELNILDSSAEDIVYINNGTNETSVYAGGIASIEFPTSDPLTLEEVDVCVSTGAVAKLGLWSLRRFTDDASSANYHRGYFTLEQVLGEVTAVNNHAVFTLDNLSIDPTSTEQVLIVSCDTNKLGAHTNVVNDLMPMWYTSNYGFSETVVGEENPTALWHKLPTGNYGIQPAYKVTYSQGGTITATPIKTVVESLNNNVDAIRTATASDVGKALKAKTVTDGKVTEWEFGITGSDEVITDVNYLDTALEKYTSVVSASASNLYSIPITPNADTEYYIKSALVLTYKAGTEVAFSIFSISNYYEQQDPLNGKKFTRALDIATIVSDSNGIAKIEFDVPLRIKPDEQALVALTNGKYLKYGAYVDAEHTIFNYDHNWWGLKVGEYYDRGYQYQTSGNCPYYEIEYVLASDADEIIQTTQQIIQTDKNYNQYDRVIDETSNNAVRNSSLYNELNIVKTEIIEPTPVSYKNAEAINPNGYNGYFTTVWFNEDEPVVLQKLDIRVKTGKTVKAGIWTYRPHSASSVQGYLTLKSDLGSVVSVDTHAVFSFNDVAFNPLTDIIGVAASAGDIGYTTGVINGFDPVWFNSDNGFYDTQVGSENSKLMNKPGKTTSTSGTVQGLYEVTYKLQEAKVVTTINNVKETVSTLMKDVADLKEDAKNVQAVSDGLRNAINKYFVIIVDDVSRDALRIADRLLSVGVKPAYALKMESIGSNITWDEVRELQSLGFEICFHGMLHSRYPSVGDEGMIADIAEYKQICAEQGIVLYGYAGPNHYPLPVGAFKEFEWARTPNGLQGYGVPGHLATTFASVGVWSCDPGDMAAIKSTMIAAASSVENNQYLAPMCHTQNLYAYIDDYMEVFESWIAAGLRPLRPMDAVKQSLFNSGGIGNNSTFEIQAGTATNPYYLIAGNGTVLTNQNI